MPIVQSTYQYSSLESLLRTLTGTLGVDNKVTEPTIKKIVNKNLLDIANELIASDAPDYGEEQILGDAATFYSTTVVTGSYVNATKTITDSGHGLTKADIGKRIILFDYNTLARAGVSTVASILTTSTFTIADAMGGNIATLGYVVLSRQSTSSLDVSNLRIAKIIKLVDGTNGLATPVDSNKFEGLDIEDYDYDVFYNYFGQSLYLQKGREVANYGTLKLFYYRLPTLVTSLTDYIDLEETKIPNLILRCEADIYRLANQVSPIQAKA